MSFRSALAVVGVAVTIAGCKAPKHAYPVTVAEALARLENADVIGFRNARSAAC